MSSIKKFYEKLKCKQAQHVYLGNSPCTLQTYSFSICLFLNWLSSSCALDSILLMHNKFDK